MSASRRKGPFSLVQSLFGTLLGHYRRPSLKSLCYFGPYLAASWDARRLASAWPAASCAGPTGASHAPERFSALRPPLDSGSVKQRMQNPGRKSAPRERDGLFEIVSWPETRCCPHPEERAC